MPKDKIKAIIFDWGGTLADSYTKQEFTESKKILNYCKKKGYRLALAVIASQFEERKKQINNSGLKNFFEIALVDQLNPEQIYDITFTGKDRLYDQINEYFKLPKNQILIIDDRTVRGIRYANQHGHPSIWFKKGKFANELPTKETGQPTYIISNLAVLRKIL